jgi:hypothetical protein
MAVKELKRAAVVAAQTNRTIRVTHKAYDLAVNLFDNDADKVETPVTKDMIVYRSLPSCARATH